MLIGTHNTFTYLPPMHWWQWPLLIAARCQTNDLQTQFALGARCFDIRVRFRKDGSPFFAHGMVGFRANAMSMIITFLNKLDHPVYLRIILETNRPDARQENLFANFCASIDAHSKAVCFGGRRKSDWRKLYDFRTPEVRDDQVCQIVGSMRSTYGKLLPRLWNWANRDHIHRCIEAAPYNDNYKILLTDFL